MPDVFDFCFLGHVKHFRWRDTRLELCYQDLTTWRYCNNNTTPRILGFKRLPGGWFYVAMEYLSDACPLYVADLLQSHMKHWEKLLRELVLTFHQEGFVHGDLRAANIICKGDQIFLIGFDWAGKAGEASYPIDLDHLNLDLLKGRNSPDKVITVDDHRVLTN